MKDCVPALDRGYMTESSADGKQRHSTDTGRQRWETLVDELRNTQDIGRMRQLVMLLEEAIFFRQQDLALNAHKIDRAQIEQEEARLKEALNLLLHVKVKKLGFPEIR